MKKSIHMLGRVLTGHDGKLLLGLLIMLVLLQVLPEFTLVHSLDEYAGLHALLELVSVIVTLLVAVSVFHGHEDRVPNSYAVMGCLFVLSACFNVLHILSYPGMPTFITPSALNKTVFFGLLDRACAITGFLTVTLLPNRSRSHRTVFHYGIATLVFALTIAWLGLWHPDALPQLFTSDGPTLTRQMLGWLMALLGLIAGYRLLSSDRLPHGTLASELAVAAWITALVEMCLTLHDGAYDEFNVIAHLYKAISYALVFRALFLARLRYPYDELNKVKRELLKVEQRWKYALDGSETGVWDLDLVNRKLFISDQLGDMLGYERGELSDDPHDWWSLIHPDDLAGVEASFYAHLNDETKAWHSEHRVRMRDGNWRWVMNHGRIMTRHSDGTPLRMLGTMRNIQRRKEKEQQLRANQQRLRAIFDAAPLGMVLMDAHGTIQTYNRMLTTLIGHHETLHGTNLWHWVAPQDAANARADWYAFRRKMRDAASNDTPLQDFQQEYRIKCLGSSQQRWMEWIVTPLPEENLYLALIEDIDALRRETELLEENEQLYRGSFESNNAIKLLLDPNDGSIVDANAAAARFYGYPLDEFKRMSLSSLYAEDDAHQQVSEQKMLYSPDEQYFETRHRLADGTLRDIAVYVGPIRIGGRALLYSIVHDITDRKRTEQALNLLNQRLERQNESRQRLNRLSVQLYEDMEPNDIVTLLQTYLPDCFEGAQGELLLTLEEFSYRPVTIAWGGAMASEAMFEHVEPLRVGAARLGQLKITADLDNSDDQEQLKQLASECAKMITLTLVNLRLLRQLTREAYRDVLTGLYNRRHLEAELPPLLAKARPEAPLSLALIDLDHFKHLNDTYGHDMGDEVLKALAGILEHSLRGSDMPCRYGGEEFVIVMPGANADIALKRLNQILRKFSATAFESHDERIEHLTFSAGLIEAPRQGTQMADLIELADQALYSAKHAGRGRVICASLDHETSVS